MSKTTFEDYLREGSKRGAFGDTPEDDFAQDAMRDPKFIGRHFTEWDALHAYLVFRRADSEAIKAARKLFKKWKTTQ